MKTLTLFVLIMATTFVASGADIPPHPGKVGFAKEDTPSTVLARQVDQMVDLRLKSGEKISGRVKAVGDRCVHLGALMGQEFYDAVVVMEDISAIVIRVGGKPEP